MEDMRKANLLVLLLLLIASSFYQQVYSQNGEVNQLNISTHERDSIAFFLSQMYGLDQGIRQEELSKKHPGDIQKIWSSVDSINFDKFIAFVDKYGIPTQELLGEHYKQESVRGSTAVILLHNPHRLFHPEVYALLKREVAAGRLRPKALAISLDKYFVFYKKKSIYNSDFKALVKAKGVLLSDKAQSDSLRRDIGLEALPDSMFVKE